MATFEQYCASDDSQRNHHKWESGQHRPPTEKDRPSFCNVLIDHKISPAAVIALQILR
jgi:hypothetical protein